MKHRVILAALVASFGLGSCTKSEAPRTTLRLELSVAPLNLPGVVDACYGLSVLNDADQLVWSEPSICADAFGDGQGGITFVGACDATDDDGDGLAQATAVLTVAGLYGPDGSDADALPDALSDWVNPCAPPHALNGCRIQTLCTENQDVTVTFNLAIMRRANQGFFDLAVTFEDIFCSAKVDCVNAGGGPLKLVFDPVTGLRVQTVVWAFACTDGQPGGTVGESTHLYMDDLVLRCGDDTYLIDPSAGPGNLYASGAAPLPLAQAMVFEGRELITNAGAEADKLYWNVALGLRETFFQPASGTPPNCVLETVATASEGPLVNGTPPADTAYPYIRVSVPLNSGSTLTCTRHPLDGSGPNGGVETRYAGGAVGGGAIVFDTEGRRIGSGAGDDIVTERVGAGACAGNPCGVHATCTVVSGAASCACDSGYSGDGQTCTDTDGCSPSPCYTSVSCSDVPAPGTGFSCGPCPAGMTGDGVTCAPQNACNPACGVNADCVQTDGVYGCVCRDGTLDVNGDGSSCLSILSEAAGQEHSCAIVSSGALYCWGLNSDGQLGIGSTTTKYAPVRVGGSASWTEVAAGDDHTCGIQAGNLYCWGLDASGQVGDGASVVPRTSPFQVNNPAGVAGSWTSVSGGTSHTCGVFGGRMYCWGGATSTAPVAQGASTTWTEVACGRAYTCGLRDGGELWCWTWGGVQAQVGDAAARWLAVDIGYGHRCAVRSDGTLHCWGDNATGQLGDGTLTDRAAPTQVGNMTNWTAITAGWFHTCGVAGGSLYCWGKYNIGALGTMTVPNVPNQVGGATDWSGVTAGENHNCGRRGGTVQCWGHPDVQSGTNRSGNIHGQLGDGGMQRASWLPYFISREVTWTAVDMGERHGCGIRSGGLYCWGQNTNNVLGNGAATSTRSEPFQLANVGDGNPDTWTAIATGAVHNCGIANGRLFCWGKNGDGQLGDNSLNTRATPVQVGNRTDWTQIAVGGASVAAATSYHSCGIATGELWCWGDNTEGQLGDGSTTERIVPTRVGAFADWTAVTAGRSHSCGIRTTVSGGSTASTLWCWGLNTDYQLGDGTVTRRTSPTAIAAAITTWTAVAAGAQSTCGIEGGRLRCWGDNTYSQLGINGVVRQTTPTQVGVLADWSSLALTWYHGCARRVGDLYCWGLNASGQAGRESLAEQPVPVVVAASNLWQNNAVGNNGTCAISTDGTLACLGDNTYGQRGFGYAFPRPVMFPPGL